MKPEGILIVTWESSGYSDANYEGDNNVCKRVTVYVVLIKNLVIIWHLMSRKTDTLLVTEAEYSEIIEVRLKLLFTHLIF